MDSADFVFAFVNPYDEEWRKDYAAWFTDEPVNNPRQSKSPRLLRYFLRSVARNMPWVNRTYMVVARDSQVSSWVNRDAVKVVTHGEIIDQAHLPTFNTMTIIKFLNLIPGLGERYVFSNDDWYAMAPIDENMMFDPAGRPMQHFSSVAVKKYADKAEMDEDIRQSKYSSICFNTYRKFKDAFGEDAFGRFDGDLCLPKFMHNYMICRKDEVEKVELRLKSRADVFRKGRDSSDYDFMAGYVMMNAARTQDGMGVQASTALTDDVFVRQCMNAPREKFMEFLDLRMGESRCFCINHSSGRVRDMVAEWLDARFPDKCKYEV